MENLLCIVGIKFLHLTSKLHAVRWLYSVYSNNCTTVRWKNT